jgi:hypothetical protein
MKNKNIDTYTLANVILIVLLGLAVYKFLNCLMQTGVGQLAEQYTSADRKPVATIGAYIGRKPTSEHGDS